MELDEAIRAIPEKGFLDTEVNIAKEELASEIDALRKEKNAIILAHYYQVPEIQDIADCIGDSLALAQKAASTSADLIVFAGVHFMAETAKILNPKRKVVLPDLLAGCSLADSCPPADFRKFIEDHPGHTVISYINCSAEIKSMSDVVCTSSNAVKIIQSIPEEQPIIFAPDVNLGKFLINETGRNMLLWHGSCVVHEAFSMDKLVRIHKQHPQARIVAHPESEHHILQAAHFIGSTAKMLNYVKNEPAEEFIIATEAGILHQMQKNVTGKKLIPAPAYEENSCACSECAFMKLNTLQKLYLCMKYELPEIEVDDDLRIRALRPIERMLELSE
ncbi:MAG: quinolinate synthase NadA [Flavobacteriales bacterium]